MIVTCAKCRARYDDAVCWTICPHNNLDVEIKAVYCKTHDLYNCYLCDVTALGPVKAAVIPITKKNLPATYSIINQFRLRLVGQRKRKKITQRQLAKISGIDVTVISRFETGNRKPNIKNLRALCLALRVSADFLLGITDDPTPKS